MQRYEYRVVPAPRKGEKARGLKSTEDRFAYALSRVMNDMAREGWDYQRTDTLPVEERSGLTGTKTVFQNMLVFRKTLAAPAPAAQPSAPAAAVVAPSLQSRLVETPAPQAEADPLDLAARRAALNVQPEAGAAPKLTIGAASSLSAPALGPAKADEPPKSLAQ